VIKYCYADRGLEEELLCDDSNILVNGSKA
jgi:hypothetical protein